MNETAKFECEGVTPCCDRCHVDEDAVLQVGYTSLQTETYPFNKDIAACSSKESAYLLDMEMEHMKILPELAFHALEEKIHPMHRERMERIWHKVEETRKTWIQRHKALYTKWVRDIPQTVVKDETIRLVRDAKMKVRDEFVQAAALRIDKYSDEVDSSDDDGSSDFLSPEMMWRIDEKMLRKGFYEADKNYLVAMRLYYEMLLELPVKQQKATYDLPLPPVLSNDRSLRFKIAVENRYLRLIDSVHQAISVAKAATHQQGKGRMRKTEEVPYITHVWAVTLAEIADVVPFIIEGKQFDYDLALGAVVCALHDLPEDTKLSVDDIVNFYKEHADKYDSTIDPQIESGFGRNRNEFKKEKLDLVTPEFEKKLRENLLVMSKKTELDGKMRGRGKAEFEQTKTYKIYPHIDDEKMNSFFYRLLSIPKKKARQKVLVNKNEDRANNMETPIPDAKKQHINLIGTVTRLILYQMLDHDHVKYPVYNSLARLIDTARTRYECFMRESPEEINEEDRKYLDQLIKWQVEVKRFQVPAEVKRVFDSYDETRAQWQQDSSVSSS